MIKRYALFLLILASCANDNDPAADKSNFTRIYDSNSYTTSYFPIDMKQTADGGYIVLGGRKLEDSNFSGIYILKTDESGAFVSDLEIEADYVNPVGELIALNNNFYFFCMTSVGLQTHLVEIDQAGAISQILNVGGSYPAAAALDNTNFVLLNYDNLAKQSVLSIVSPIGEVSQSAGFSIGAGDAVEEPIINHFIRTGRQYPFQVGKISSGQYFFNGFYNYTFSLVFTDLNGSDPSGVIQGQQDDGGISQVAQLNGNSFAAARFNFGDNYIIPNANLATSGTTSSVDLGGFTLPELTPNAPIKIVQTLVNDKDVIIYASNTRSRQISLLVYDKATGEFLGSRYLGFSNPYEINNVVVTVDEGLAICATTYVAGRFPRICIFKLSKEELGKIF